MGSGGPSAAVFVFKQAGLNSWFSMKILAYLSRVIRLLVFLLLLAFAAKNTEPVALHFFLGQTWELPLSLLLFAFFALGAVIAVLACVTRFYRDKREIRTLRVSLGLQKGHESKTAEAAIPAIPPRDAVI